MAAMLLAATRVSMAGPDGAAAPLPLLQPAVVEYRWTFLTPQWVVEAREVETQVYAPRLHAKRIDYAALEFETVHRKVARVAEFSCKYLDFWLPNECRTRWRDLYVDVPVPVVRKDYIEVDMPRWSWQDWRTAIEVPRLVWKEETLVVSLPAIAVGTARR